MSFEFDTSNFEKGASSHEAGLGKDQHRSKARLCCRVALVNNSGLGESSTTVAVVL